MKDEIVATKVAMDDGGLVSWGNSLRGLIDEAIHVGTAPASGSSSYIRSDRRTAVEL